MNRLIPWPAALRRASFPCSLAIALVATVLITAGVVQAQDIASQIDAHLTAGEFASALALVERAPATQRDVLLREIAEAQNAAGARSAADTTTGRIVDDRVRAQTLDQLFDQRFGRSQSDHTDPVLAQSIGGGQGGQGGASNADFDALIELITKTIEPESWDDTGGPGSVATFEGGIVVDPAGVMRRTTIREEGRRLRELYQAARRSGDNRRVRTTSRLRKVSLPRLEKAVHTRLAGGRQPNDEMQLLAGITRVSHVFVYPETGDLVIAGPAGDWRRDEAGRLVSAETGRPVLRLEDLVVILRSITADPNDRISCSITPRKDALAATQKYLAHSATKALPAGAAARRKWMDGITAAMGRQDIEFRGVDPASRVAKILVEADHHMKLVGIGIEEGTAGVKSYLDSIQLKKGQAPPPLDVLRWWFTLNYSSIGTTKDLTAFEIHGPGVQVLSENEMLTRLGQRVQTGRSGELNSLFAQSFSSDFAALAARYPIYAELQNIFDLALVAAINDKYQLAQTADWRMTCFGDPDRYELPTYPVPREVHSVMNHRIVNGNRIIAAVSGGVRLDPGRLLAEKPVASDDPEFIGYQRESAEPPANIGNHWWWD